MDYKQDREHGTNAAQGKKLTDCPGEELLEQDVRKKSRRDNKSSSQRQLLQTSLQTRSIQWAWRTGNEEGLVKAVRDQAPSRGLLKTQAEAAGADSPSQKLAVACSGLEDTGTQQLHPQAYGAPPNFGELSLEVQILPCS